MFHTPAHKQTNPATCPSQRFPGLTDEQFFDTANRFLAAKRDPVVAVFNANSEYRTARSLHRAEAGRSLPLTNTFWGYVW